MFDSSSIRRSRSYAGVHSADMIGKRYYKCPLVRNFDEGDCALFQGTRTS
jgi:hypothetical protein